jgi:hypothetical protein
MLPSMALGPPVWLKTVLPIAALAVVPIVGIFYVSFGSFGKKGAASAPSASGSSITMRIAATEIPDDMPGGKPLPGVAKMPRPTSLYRGGPPSPGAQAKDPGVKLCCEKLADMVLSAEPSVKASYSAAATACNAAPTNEAAMKQVTSILEGSQATLPPECQRD